eukprot:scaffold781_cov394-Prasinococcus_capsulatus_cf.AAC.25
MVTATELREPQTATGTLIGTMSEMGIETGITTAAATMTGLGDGIVTGIETAIAVGGIAVVRGTTTDVSANGAVIGAEIVTATTGMTGAIALGTESLADAWSV